MAARERFAHRPQPYLKTTPFISAEEAWFWFMQSHEARLEGARILGGQALVARPCEPMDILKIVDRLYRQRRLMRDHVLVLRHYGRRRLAPDPVRPKEMRAHRLWAEALQRIGQVMERRGLVVSKPAKQPMPIVSPIHVLPRAYWPSAASPIFMMSEGVAAE